LIQPGDFISVAEQTGLIRNLTEFVLDEALAQLVRWQFEGLDLTVAVNISARVLHDIDFPALVALMLADHDVPGRRLVLELTESMIMADPERSIRALTELRALGVELSVDDYGTGHSSLAYLKRLPINEIKIDKSFITHMADDTNDDLITGSTIDLGRRLGLRVVAEGVESNEALVRLRHLGCDLAQGFYFARPLPADKLQPWLDRNGERVPSSAHDRPNVGNLYALPTSRLA
jgi:EAL domain-containing protein (putative c-di-GMP-specific phosphodiesterase class I)